MRRLRDCWAALQPLANVCLEAFYEPGNARSRCMIPPLLVKAFEKFKYARAFVDGHIRFSTLAYYRSIADPGRRDETEGYGEVHVDGDAPVFQHGQNPSGAVESIRVRTRPHERYICCLSIPDAVSVPNLKAAFGNNFVVVHSPEEFVRDVKAALFKSEALACQGIEFEHGIIRYDKSEYVGTVCKEDEIKNLAWQQKPRDYWIEREYRLCFRLAAPMEGSYPEHIIVSTGFSLSYCEAITVD